MVTAFISMFCVFVTAPHFVGLFFLYGMQQPRRYPQTIAPQSLSLNRLRDFTHAIQNK